MPAAAHVFPRRLAFALLAFAAVAAPPFATRTIGALSNTAPVKNFQLPTFNDTTGHRTSLLTGREARYIGATQIEVVDMHFTAYVGDEANTIYTILLAPSATVLLEDNRPIVQGEKSMRFIHDAVDATGDRWRYDHDRKRILLEKNVRVVFRAGLKDILK